jgi:tRNA threonylcarbamoyladenosine biosynthesis protein TsaE
MDFKSKSLEDSKQIVQKLIDTFPNEKVFLLYGDLGSGKTLFVSDFLKVKNIKARVQSPTFVVHKIYDSKVHHLDLYRLNAIDELEDIDFDSVLSAKDTFIFIEWPELVAPLFSSYIKVEITMEDLNTRMYKVEKIEK